MVMIMILMKHIGNYMLFMSITNWRCNMTDYEESYKNYLAWLTPRELLQEYKIMRFPWRYREREWVKEEIERRCVY